MEIEKKQTAFDVFLKSNETAAFIDDMPDEVYHAEKRFVSKHRLDVLDDSPEKYKAEFLDETVSHDETAALIFGRALHAAVLEPETFSARFAALPNGLDRRTKAGKEEFAAFSEANAGKTILKSEEILTISAMKKALESHDVARSLLFGKDGVNELTVLAKHPSYGGLPCKCRIDRFLPKSGLLLDLKTCASASPKAITSAVKDFRYDVQAVFYRQLLEIANAEANRFPKKQMAFALVCIEKTEPFAVGVYLLSSWESLASACLSRNLSTLTECLASGEWSGYSVPENELPMPKYAEIARGF